MLQFCRQESSKDATYQTKIAGMKTASKENYPQNRSVFLWTKLPYVLLRKIKNGVICVWSDLFLAEILIGYQAVPLNFLNMLQRSAMFVVFCEGVNNILYTISAITCIALSQVKSLQRYEERT